MNKRFSMLPGGGLWTRYTWCRFLRHVDELRLSLITLADVMTEATDAMREFQRAWEQNRQDATNAPQD